MELESLLDLDQKDTMLDNNSRSIVTKDDKGNKFHHNLPHRKGQLKKPFINW